MSVTSNVPYGKGYSEQEATNYASELARVCDQLNSLSNYAVDTYSPYSPEEIAQYWAGEGNTPTAEQLQKANEFKAWLSTVDTMINTSMEGDLGYQIRKWRNADVYVSPLR